MKSTSLFQGANHEWVVFGRDPDKPEKIIDTNQYLVKSGDNGILLDPGGIEIFAPMLTAVLREIPLENITDIFASHQDPDIISSLGLWDKALPDSTLHSPWLWEGFIRHFGMENMEYHALPDEGGTLRIGNIDLHLIPAHYVHSSGNFSVYDPISKILMSGDAGAALEHGDVPLFVENFDDHIQYMKGFHQRWMPSNQAKNDWIYRVRALDVEILAPQHGRLFKGDDVKKFLDWFEALNVGTAIK